MSLDSWLLPKKAAESKQPQIQPQVHSPASKRREFNRSLSPWDSGEEVPPKGKGKARHTGGYQSHQSAGIAQGKLLNKRQHTDYAADFEDSDAEGFDRQSRRSKKRLSKAPSHANPLPSSTAPVSEPLLALLERVNQAAESEDALAKTLSPIISHFRAIADTEQIPLDEAKCAFRNSICELSLQEALTLFDKDDGNLVDGFFSEALISTLLANEDCTSSTSCFAPSYTVSQWLGDNASEVSSRVAKISADIIDVLNCVSTDDRKLPFQQIQDETIRRVFFLYNPTGSNWVTVEAVSSSPVVNGKRTKLGSVHVANSSSSVEARATYDAAREELRPLMTLASLSSLSPFQGTHWDVTRFALSPTSAEPYRTTDSGPVAVMTAVFKANDEAVPLKPNEASARRGLTWRTRLACARRLLILVQEANGLSFIERTLFELMKRHLGPGFIQPAPLPAAKRSALAKKYAPVQDQNLDSDEESDCPAPAPKQKRAGHEPYRPRERYACPFKAPFKGTKPCGAYFANSHGRSKHVATMHDQHGIPFPDDSSEDGTLKVKCPNRCGTLFRSYKKAKEHTSRDCKQRPKDKFQCPWGPIIGCTKMVNMGGLGNHLRSHFKDQRGPYRCHKCQQYYADRYTLGAHVDDCKGDGAKPRATNMMRISLSKDDTVPPEVIIIARSSAAAPEEWKAKKDTIEDGLPIFGRTILQQFRQATEIRLPAVLHVGWNMRTRELPADQEYKDRFEDTETNRCQKNRAFKWTKAINDDIFRARKPMVVSVGWDGWTCCTDRLPEWLDLVPNTRYFVRLTGLQYEADPKLLKTVAGLYWAEFETAAIAKALSDRTSRTPELAQLIRIWDHIQASKDSRSEGFSLFQGRNLLMINDLMTDVSTEEAGE